jgi:hypothetical protein
MGYYIVAPFGAQDRFLGDPSQFKLRLCVQFAGSRYRVLTHGDPSRFKLRLCVRFARSRYWFLTHGYSD